MIRIGSSCALSTSMALGKVVETRRFIGAASGWEAVCKQAIRDKQYLILNPCIDRNDNSGHYPNDIEWINIISNTCTSLKSFGGTNKNSRISLVNEPMKFCTKEQYAHLIKLAYPIVHNNGFLCGAGNEEFLTAQARGFMYQYILNERKAGRINFDILDIHIQGSCNTPEMTKMWADEVISWCVYWGIKADCTEAFYDNIAKSKGWALLQSQLYHAERIGCANFCNVFNNIDTKAWSWDISNWFFLAFKVNGVLRSNYWAHWKILMDTRGPVPNIKEDKGVKDGMILQTLYDKEYEIINDVKFGPYKTAGYLVEWVQMILKKINNSEMEPFYDGEVTGVYDNITKLAVESFQKELGETGYPNITVDGKWGRKMYGWASEILIEQDSADGLTMDRLLHKWAAPRK